MQNLYQHPFPPQNYIAEEILLGIILIYPQVSYNIIPTIKTEYFFLERHQIIYINLIEIYKNNKLNSTDLFYNLSKTKILYKIGGIYKILEIMKQSQIFISSSEIYIYIEELIKIINYNYIKRLLIQYGHNIIKLAYIPKISNDILYNKASNYLNFTENKIPKNNNIKTFKQLISNFLIDIQYNKKKIKENKRNNTENISVKSGFKEIDKLTTGLTKGDLIVLAGRPSMGKTSLAINIAYNISYQLKSSISIFSLEMSSKQILNKFISIVCNISTQSIVLNNLSIQQWNNIKEKCNNLLNFNIYINDEPNISIDYIEYNSKLLQKEDININLIIIDYLQLIQIDTLHNTTRTQELSYITRKLKLLAQYLNVPIIILSQLNRSIENRNDKTPVLSDLRESGCINYINNISISNYLNHSINVRNIKHKFINIQTINNLTINLKFNSLLIQKALETTFDIFIQYTFNYYLSTNKIISTTHNHKYLYNTKWIQANNILDNSIIAKEKNYYLYYCNINRIQFLYYSKCYDLNTKYYYNFISKHIILHNSIEQDADIVMILYEKNKNKNNLNNHKILDLTLCKNRNGPIGSCELFFSLKNTKFKDIDISKNFNLINEIY